MNLKDIKNLMNEQKYEEALRLIDLAISNQNDNSFLWILRGNAIQLAESPSGPPLEEAERSYLQALSLNGRDLYAIESIAHFYDAVVPNADKAKFYAQEYLDLTEKVRADMCSILKE